jgi:hypothetical protein
MGDCQTEPLRPLFDRRLRLEFHGANVTSDAGLLAYRELDDALQLTDSASDVLLDTRTGRNTRHGLAALLGQSLFSRLAGYEDLNDAQRLRVDPAMRMVGSGRAGDRTAASTSEIGRFETDTLTTRDNLNRLMDLSNSAGTAGLTELPAVPGLASAVGALAAEELAEMTARDQRDVPGSRALRPQGRKCRSRSKSRR